jgi:hypothetical protein
MKKVAGRAFQASNGLQGVTSQKIGGFITTAARISNAACTSWFMIK